MINEKKSKKEEHNLRLNFRDRKRLFALAISSHLKKVPKKNAPRALL